MKLLNDRYLRRLLLALAVIITVYVLGLLYWDKITDVLRMFPIYEKIYQLTFSEVAKRSVLGLSLVTFFGSLFFIGFPGELIFMIYLRIGYNFFVVSFIMLFFAMVAQIINYCMGYFIEKKLLERFMKTDKRDYLASLKKYDTLFIVVINILPLPGDILTVILGMIKYDFRKTMFYSAAGKILKYIFLGFIVLMLKFI